MGNRLFVGNLPYSADENQLRQFFTGAGRQVVEVKIVTDAATGRSRGFGFVELASASEAEQAIQELNGADLGGRRIVVNEAQERRSGGGGRRDFGGGGGRGFGGGGGNARDVGGGHARDFGGGGGRDFGGGGRRDYEGGGGRGGRGGRGRGGRDDDRW